MRKRGPAIGIIGVGFLLLSFVFVMSVFPGSNPTMSGEINMADLFEGVFDHVISENQIFPSESRSFSYTSSTSEIPLLWGVQITDYQRGDQYSVIISNSFVDNLGAVEHDGPILFEMFIIPKNDIYNFEVTNTGERPITIIMMFSEDPDNSAALTDPNSPLMSTVVPLAISGIFLFIGIILMVVGTILTIIDWRKGQQNQSRYNT